MIVEADESILLLGRSECGRDTAEDAVSMCRHDVRAGKLGSVRECVGGESDVALEVSAQVNK